MEYLDGTYRKRDAEGHVCLRLQRLPRGGDLAMHAGVGQQGGQRVIRPAKLGRVPEGSMSR